MVVAANLRLLFMIFLLICSKFLFPCQLKSQSRGFRPLPVVYEALQALGFATSTTIVIHLIADSEIILLIFEQYGELVD